MNSRTVTTELNEILDLIACSHVYGYANDILLDAFARVTGWVTDEEISAYAEAFVSDELRAQGYGPEDRDETLTVLTIWRNEYCNKPGTE